MTKIQLLDGRSVQSRATQVFVGIAGMFFFILCVIVFLFAFDESLLFLVMYGFVGVLLMGLWMAIAATGFSHRVEDEMKAGYITWRFAQSEVPMVDYKTGVIIREAGEPLLDWRTARARRKSAREAT